MMAFRNALRCRALKPRTCRSEGATGLTPLPQDPGAGASHGAAGREPGAAPAPPGTHLDVPPNSRQQRRERLVPVALQLPPGLSPATYSQAAQRRSGPGSEDGWSELPVRPDGSRTGQSCRVPAPPRCPGRDTLCPRQARDTAPAAPAAPSFPPAPAAASEALTRCLRCPGTSSPAGTWGQGHGARQSLQPRRSCCTRAPGLPAEQNPGEQTHQLTLTFWPLFKVFILVLGADGVLGLVVRELVLPLCRARGSRVSRAPGQRDRDTTSRESHAQGSQN